MNSKKRKYFPELLALIINILSALIIFIAPIPDKTQSAEFQPGETQSVAVLVIASVSLVLLVFKNDVIDKVDEKLRIYQLFEGIDDKDLREMGTDYINLCCTKLEELSRGVLKAQSSELLSFLGEKVANARVGVRATLVVETPESLGRWMNPPASNYYEINKVVAQSGRKFQRIFIVSRDRFFREGFFDLTAGQIILKQKEDGLEVYIVYEEDLQNLKVREDFVIVDRELVHINDTGAVTLGGWRTRVSKNRVEVAEYEKKFDTLLAYAQKPERIISIDSQG